MPVAPEPLRRAKELIDRRYFDPLDVPTLARTARLSPAHFSREFHRAFGEPPHQYLISRRMKRAATLLRCSDQSVAEICRSVGLRSVGSFTTCFGRTFGKPPARFRAAGSPSGASHPREMRARASKPDRPAPSS
jgi:AraC-like DNA-binding protein